MGRSRWRNRTSNIPSGTRTQRSRTNPPTDILEAKVSINSITPECPGMRREGLDGVVFLALRQVDEFVRDMRVGIQIPNAISDEHSAVQRYLAYLSMLVDVALSDIAMSAIHCNDLAVEMKARMMVEYVSKAIYCDAHPDFALWFTTIGEAKSVAAKLERGGADSDLVAAAKNHVAQQRKRFSHVAQMNRVPLADMMHEQTREPGEHRNDEYVWLYGAPSAIMHGDPEGMRRLLPVDDNGIIHPELGLSDGYVNALMVDTGANALAFCEVFIRRFHPDSKELPDRVAQLRRTFQELCLRHTEGRDEDAVERIREELSGADGEPSH